MPSLVEIGSVVLEKRIFFNFINVFSLFRNYLPLEKGGDLHLKKLESPSPKDAFGQVWLKFSQHFAEIVKNNKTLESLLSVHLGVAWFPGPALLLVTAFSQGARGPGLPQCQIRSVHLGVTHSNIGINEPNKNLNSLYFETLCTI